MNFKIGVQQIMMKPQYLFYKERTTYSAGNWSIVRKHICNNKKQIK